MKSILQSIRQTRWRSRAQHAWFRLCEVCLSLYIGYAAYLAQSGLFRSGAATVGALCGYALVCAAVFAALEAATAWLCAYGPKTRKRGRTDMRVFLAALAIALAIYGACFAACYPGGVNYDISNQWRQAHSGEYNNWHPVFHTLLMRGLTMICDRYPFCVLVQIMACALLTARLTATLHRVGVPAWLALCAQTAVALSPLMRGTLMYLGKDSAMTLGVLALTAEAANALYTRGEWLRSPWRCIRVGVLLACVTLLRVNALLWTVPFWLCLFLTAGRARKGAALSLGVMLAVMAAVQGPLYGMLDIVYPDNTAEESVGLPMTVLCDVRALAPEKLDAQTLAFLDALAPDEAWRTVYRPNSYNSIKFTYPRELIKETPLAELLSMSARAAAAAPRIAFEAFNGLTDLVWGLTGKDEGVVTARNSGDIPGESGGHARLNALGGYAVKAFDAVTSLPGVRYVTRNIGVQLLALLLVALWALRRHGVRALTLALPTLIYHLGTMLLLCGNDARFFQFGMAVSLPSMLALVFLPDEEDETCS